MGVADIAVTFRANVGKFKTLDGRWFDTGLPVGFSDLFGFRKSDNKIIFLEVKTPTGRPSAEQIKFLEAVRKHGCIADIVHSVEEARQLIINGSLK